MLIKFINLGLDAPTKMHNLLSSNNNDKFLFRQNGFFHNRFYLELYKQQNPDVTIYTDDETMLHYAQYDQDIHSFKVDMLFLDWTNEDEHVWVSLKDLHPNLREVNNIVSMYHKGIFDDDFEDYVNKQKGNIDCE